MKEPKVMVCKECGSEYFKEIGREDPVDKVGRCLITYVCKNSHIKKKVVWGRMSTWFVLQRLAKLEKM